MKVSMDGLRKNLSHNTGTLRDIVNAVLAGNFYENDDLIEAMNNVIRDSNVLNCVYSTDDELFNDISDVELSSIDGEA